jgi:hypothetical protein
MGYARIGVRIYHHSGTGVLKYGNPRGACDACSFLLKVLASFIDNHSGSKHCVVLKINSWNTRESTR